MIEKCKKTKIKITDKDQEFFEQLTQIQRVDAPDFFMDKYRIEVEKPNGSHHYEATNIG